MIQVGGGTCRSAAAARRDETCATFVLGPSDWVVDFGARLDAFGLATLDAHGWFDSHAHFDLKLSGDVTLGSSSFGLIGGFTFRVFLREEADPTYPVNSGVLRYHFGVQFSAEVVPRPFSPGRIATRRRSAAPMTARSSSPAPCCRRA